MSRPELRPAGEGGPPAPDSPFPRPLPPREGPGRQTRTDLDGVIADLQRRHQQLSDYIDEHKDEMRAGQFITAIDYQGRLANRIGRLLRDRQQLAGEQADALDEAVAEALAIVGEAWGVALTPQPPLPPGERGSQRPVCK